MARHVVATAGEIPVGGRKIVEVAGISIGIFNLGGEFFALRNRCPHQGGPLCEGKLWGTLDAQVPGEILYARPGEIIGCLWHGWEFDIRTGQSWCEPRRLRARQYTVSVESGASLGPVAKKTTATDAEALSKPDAQHGAGDLPEDDLDISDQERVKGPYIAETYVVTGDGAYIVVDIDP